MTLQSIQAIVLFVSQLLVAPMVIWMGFIGLWMIGAPPYHRAFRDDSMPVMVTQVPVAVCPKCGFRSTDFSAFVERIKREEMEE
jgi:hypothetical protein